MSDAFTCYPIDKLLKWVLAEEKTGSLFGIPKELFFIPETDDPFKIKRYNQILENPLGVAAGPHTQLSQNIIASWLCGARYLELKTVQVLDELEITKPCIIMEDEGYNCEWSQELKLEKSYDEYLNAWIIIHILKDKFGWGDFASQGFLFNMSVGYNMEGIQTEGVQRFLDNLSNCSSEKSEKIDQLSKLYPRIKDLDIPDCISNNITISTMHGCPPDEIEKIGQYFIEERKLNTAIKLNPTLLGPERLRGILNDTFEFEVEVPDEAFEHDLKYPDAVDLIKNLRSKADSAGVEFGLKLTNTLETLNRPGVLPEKERMVYMSGRPLHAISIQVAAQLQDSFNGELDLSFSAGVDCFNLSSVLACNLRPVTVCTDILKPGGYARLRQYIDEIRNQFKKVKANSFEAFILNTAKSGDLKDAALANLKTYASEVVENHRYTKEFFPFESIKTDRELTLFDCTQAPCVLTCPTGQDIPEYLGLTAAKQYEKAHQTILETNPFPNAQGKVCHHPCRTKCTRINLDAPLQIRGIKRFIAEQYSDRSQMANETQSGQKVAIIGAGPSGLSCAYYLALAGFEVNVFEEKATPGGMAADVIPAFRLDNASLSSDIKRIEDLGVRIHLGVKIDSGRFEEIKNQNDFVYIAIGAQESLQLGIPGEDSIGVLDQLDFLSQVKKGLLPDLGEKVLLIGAGNSAMDAARTAKRLIGKNGDVTILYRRTRKQMPADREEIEEAIAEGVSIVELVAPTKIIQKNGKVAGMECCQMKLGPVDSSGRARPEKIPDSHLNFNADTVIPAIGQNLRLDFLLQQELKVDPQTMETELPRVFAGGDAVRGAATLIEAIADGRRTAENIISYDKQKVADSTIQKSTRISFKDYQIKLAKRDFGRFSPSGIQHQNLDFELISTTMTEAEAIEEANRCLSCDLYCGICTTVCPNRANVAVAVSPITLPQQHLDTNGSETKIFDKDPITIQEAWQIINIGDFCNECGNCTTFCPTSGDPYKVKPRFCLTREAFASEESAYYLEENILYAKSNQVESQITDTGQELIFESTLLRATVDRNSFEINSFEPKQLLESAIDLSQVSLMGWYLVSLKNHYLLGS